MDDRRELGIPMNLEGQAYQAKGCDRCRGTGFQGRLAIYEVVVLSQTMQDMVAHGASAPEIRAQSIKEGFIPMRGYGWKKVMQGMTTIEEVISVTSTDVATE